MKKLIFAFLLLLVSGTLAVAANVMEPDSYTFSTMMMVDFDKTPPYVDGQSPAPGASNVPLNAYIIAHVKDDGAGVDIDSIVMRVNGVRVFPKITGDKYDYVLTHDPIQLPEGKTILVTVDASDLANN